ncbi:50S ribosomal protein L21 [Enterobacteriaceae endosymbiont of Donacia cincticornis]|uniref:50S ribosomal protein L21 n=1 Tax=Enterobacteriaceae endosymbiont of Donacia cincticornis TaxID=2675773 RepID=UPI001448E05D|nr:50S ribosomal protein L21 [Enterobacteriaceae endosymbiont of Donacia cincticornis]QJC36303.1 50S ribosomal protein L21 [Enterobacteriaceae endosymbiont of Donacia cincticornis]
MYAIFDNYGKQYKVIQGQIIQLEKIQSIIGSKIEFNNVLLIFNKNKLNIGNPIIPGGKIIAEIISHEKKKKIKIIKFRRRKHYRKTQGHRQLFTNIKIIKITSLI